MKKIFWTILFLFALISCKQGEKFPSQVDDLLNYYQKIAVEELGSPLSGAFLVEKGDSIYLKRGVGYIDDQQSKEITPDTRFYIGSVTKQFTACIILQLAQEGLINLEDTIAA